MYVRIQFDACTWMREKNICTRGFDILPSLTEGGLWRSAPFWPWIFFISSLELWIRIVVITRELENLLRRYTFNSPRVWSQLFERLAFVKWRLSMSRLKIFHSSFFLILQLELFDFLVCSDFIIFKIYPFNFSNFETMKYTINNWIATFFFTST